MIHYNLWAIFSVFESSS